MPPPDWHSIETVLQIHWPLPLWLTITLATGLAASIVGLYFSERGGSGRVVRSLLAAIRFLLFAVVIWMLAGWNWLQFRSEKPDLLVAIDRSASMETRDLDSDRQSSDAKSDRRIDGVADLFDQLSASDRKRLTDTYNLRWFYIDETAQPADLKIDNAAEQLRAMAATGSQSRLGDALTTLIKSQAGKGTAAVVLFSDGINTSGSPLAVAGSEAKSSMIPLYTVATGRELVFPDVRLADLLIDESVFLGDRVTLQLSAIASDVAEAKTHVRLIDVSTNEELDRTEVTFNRQRNQQQLTLSFLTKRAGDIPLRVEIEQIAGETNRENNAIARTITVQDRTLRVLLVQKFPSLEFRFLKNLLQRSRVTDAKAASFELSSVLQEADVEYVNQDPASRRLVPSDAETLAQYDVFVFGDVSPDLISRSAQQTIYEQVVNGGAGCLFIAGRDTPLMALTGWPIGDLLPIQLTNLATSGNSQLEDVPQYHWAPTSIGSGALPLQLAEGVDASSKLWTNLPPMVSLFTNLKPKTGSQVLVNGLLAGATDPAAATSTDRPILIAQFAGAGRVALQATDETYRWTTYGGNDLIHQRYWEQMLRWLCRGRLSGQQRENQLLIEPRRARFGQPVHFELTLNGQTSLASDAPVELSLDDGGGNQTRLRLNRDASARQSYSETKSDLAPGNYRVTLLQPVIENFPAQAFSVVTSPGEQANLRADWTALKSIADLSRGRFYSMDNSFKIFNELPVGRRARFGSLPPVPLWNQPWVVSTFVILITIEWWLRRKSRML